MSPRQAKILHAGRIFVFAWRMAASRRGSYTARRMPASFRQRINIKYFMVAYLGLLLLLASILAGDPGRFLSGAALVALYALFDVAWTRLRDRVWYLPVSSWISGLVLANVGPPAPSLWLLILLPLVAVAGKQLLHLGRSRHIFNPAGFALLVLTLFTPVISWWTASINVWTLTIIGLVGLFILWRQQRFHVAISFIAVYALGEIILGLFQGAGIANIPAVMQSVLLSGSFLFFVTVMLIEPITSGFPTREKRIVYGALVGVFSLASLLLAPWLPITDFDPFIAGLLLGNLAASLLYLPKAARPAST